MENNLFSVKMVTSWRWRCVKEGKVIYGSDLHIFGYTGSL